MKKDEIVVGGEYVAKISNKLVVVRVESIRQAHKYSVDGYREVTVYDVQNLTTRRRTTFNSAAKFRYKSATQEKETPEQRRERIQACRYVRELFAQY